MPQATAVTRAVGFRPSLLGDEDFYGLGDGMIADHAGEQSKQSESVKAGTRSDRTCV